MDPRHPEQAIDRMVDLMTQFNLVLNDMKKTTVSSQLGQLERQGGLVVQEICLVAPRLHEAMMQASRNRRHEIASGDTGHFIREATPEEAEALNNAVAEFEKKEEEKKEEKPKRKYTRKKKVEE